jgi:hypothetical protein
MVIGAGARAPEGTMTNKSKSPNLVPLAEASHRIGGSMTMITLERAAKRVGVLDKDENGRKAIPTWALDFMKRQYNRSGWLLPRGLQKLGPPGRSLTA